MKIKNTFVLRLTEQSRILEVLFDNLPNEIKNSKAYEEISEYVEKYVNFNALTLTQVIDIYYDYIVIYNKHCKQFIKSGKYPIEIDPNKFEIERLNYDIILLMSVLFTEHRFRIMQLLKNSKPLEKALFIGLGPGLELYLTKDNTKEVHAFDLSINDYLIHTFPNCEFNKSYYSNQKTNYFDGIFIIELLEHLEDPYELIQNCYNSLKVGGKLILTTATDIPQFDHLYNFPIDHFEFEKRIKNMGFTIELKEIIYHRYLTIEVKSSNHFYELVKKNKK